MSIDVLQTLENIEILENFLNRIRPPEEIRQRLDIGYRIDNQSIIIYEERPVWNQPGEIRQGDFAKATYVKSNGIWKVFWLRANLKWDAYDPAPLVKSLQQFVKLVEEDKHNCFRG